MTRVIMLVVAVLRVSALLGMIAFGSPAYGSITYTVAVTAPSGTFTFTVCTPDLFGGQDCTTVTDPLGSESLTGSITTDETLGGLATGNITDWSIQGTGAIAFNVFSQSSFFGSPGSLSCATNGCGVTATATELDFTGDSSSSLLFTNEISDFGNPISQVEELSFGSGAFSALVGDTTGFPTAGTFQMPSANYTIATSGEPTGGSAPEPGSLGLLALPLALLLRAQHRSRGGW